MKWKYLLCTILFFAVPSRTVYAAGRIDESATLVARNCRAVTRQALSGIVLADRVSSGSFAVEVRLSGEFIRDLRVTLWETESGIMAEIAQASGRAVCEQLERLYKSRPSLTQEEAAGLIEVTVKMQSESKIPVLKSLVEEVKTMRLSTSLSESLFTPNRSVAVHITNGFEEISVRFNEPEPSAESVAFWGQSSISQPQMAEWVERLLRALKLP